MKLLREPLLHFALAGGLLFGAYAWLNRGDTGAGSAVRTVRITESEVAWLAETWTRQWQRAPTHNELQGLVADYLREELLAREARSLELDRDDTVVRRRLAQKMTFFLEDTTRLAEPTEAELRALYDLQRVRFETPARSSFVQIYFSPEKRGERASEDARQTRARLDHSSATGDIEDLGDRSLLPGELVDADEQAISSQFGAEFARAVAALAPGAWQGPIESGFGLHLVRVTARQETRPRSFEEARTELVAEWRREREAKAKEVYFAGLLRKYDVQVAASVQALLGPALVAVRAEAK